MAAAYDATSTKTTYRGNAGCRTAGSETSGSSTAGYPSSSPVLSSVRQPQQQVPPPPVINLQQQGGLDCFPREGYLSGAFGLAGSPPGPWLCGVSLPVMV
ncbi:hypothetical protein Bbelb_053700 [Branchiostoma belcheri]|nr:hypothetical protein Bbelb_053700 [Branchiostoma belcheri]